MSEEIKTLQEQLVKAKSDGEALVEEMKSKQDAETSKHKKELEDKQGLILKLEAESIEK